MKAFQTWLIGGLILLVAAAIWTTGRNALTQRQSEWQTAESDRRLKMQAAWEKELEALTQRNDAALQDLSARLEADRQQRSGGAWLKAQHDPTLSIEGMLRVVAKAVVPSTAQVICTVDRFVEYALAVELPEAASPEQMAGWCRQILGPGARYLHQVRFVYKGEALSLLDRGDIEAIPDWARAETSAILDRFAHQERLMADARSRAAEAADAEKEDDSPRLQSQMSRSVLTLGDKAAQQFYSFARHFESNLVVTLRTQDRFRLMHNVDELTTRISLEARLEQLTNDLRVLESQRLLFSNPALEWDNHRPADVTEADRQSVVKQIQSSYAAMDEGKRYWEALKAEADQLQRYLLFLKRTWGVWTVEKEGVYWVKYSDLGMGQEHGRLRTELQQLEKKSGQAYYQWAAKAWGGVYGRAMDPEPAPGTRRKSLPKAKADP